MLELAILGLLKEQDLHGYELKKRLGETLGVTSGVSFGSLYPALGRLERAGAVRTVEPPDGPGERPAIPLTGSLGGELAAWRARTGAGRAATTRAAATTRSGSARVTAGRGGRSRKVYGITAQGEEVFERLLAEEQAGGDDSRLFHLRLAFAGYLSAEARLGMLERRRAHLLERLSRVGSGTRTGRRIDSYVRSLIEHDRESTEHDLSWIERLIAWERDPAARPAGEERTASPAPVAIPTSRRAPAPPRPGAAGTPSPATEAPVTEAPATPATATPASGPLQAMARPAPAIAPPTLSGLRPDAHGRTYTHGRSARNNQEEFTR